MDHPAYTCKIAMLNRHGFWYPVSLLPVPTAKDLVLIHHEISPMQSTASWDPTFDLEAKSTPSTCILTLNSEHYECYKGWKPLRQAALCQLLIVSRKAYIPLGVTKLTTKLVYIIPFIIEMANSIIFTEFLQPLFSLLIRPNKHWLCWLGLCFIYYI